VCKVSSTLKHAYGIKWLYAIGPLQ
jgi:hypothetical protein